MHDQRFLNNKIKKYKNETKGCTFTPRINYSRDEDFEAPEEQLITSTIYDRQSLWKLKKDMKVDEERTKRKRKETEN